MAAGLLALPFGTAHAAETPVYDTSQATLAPTVRPAILASA